MVGLEAVPGVGEAESDLINVAHPPTAVDIILQRTTFAGLVVLDENWKVSFAGIKPALF